MSLEKFICLYYHHIACAASFVEHFMVSSNKIIEPGGNVTKDQALLDIKQCYLNINYVTV